MKEHPLHRTEHGVKRKQSIRQVETLPDTWPEQDTPQYLYPIGEPAAQPQLITLQRPASGSILRRLESLRELLRPRVIQDPLRLAAVALQFDRTAERIRR